MSLIQEKDYIDMVTTRVQEEKTLH